MPAHKFCIAPLYFSYYIAMFLERCMKKFFPRQAICIWNTSPTSCVVNNSLCTYVSDHINSVDDDEDPSAIETQPSLHHGPTLPESGQSSAIGSTDKITSRRQSWKLIPSKGSSSHSSAPVTVQIRTQPDS